MSHDQRIFTDKPFIIVQKTDICMLTYQCDACSPIDSPQMLMEDGFDPICHNQFILAEKVIKIPADKDHYVCLAPTHRAFCVMDSTAKKMLDSFAAAMSPDEFYHKWPLQKKNSNLLAKFFNAGLIKPKGKNKQQMVQPVPSKLTAWLHLTDRCNLKCTYCYLSHRNLDMSEETGKAAIDATFRSAKIHHYHSVKLKYSGGEALLRMDLIRGLHRYALKQAQKLNLQLEGVILTNGTLISNKTLMLIQSLDLNVTVSLDGIGQSHDNQRPFMRGGGSCKQILNGIEFLLKKGISPNISVTVTGQNASQLPQLTKWLLDHNLQFIFNFYRENTLSRKYGNLELEESDIVKGLRSAFKIIEANLPGNSLLAGLADQTNLAAPHLHACSVGRSYLVYDCLGNVRKCQMQMDRLVASAKDDDPLAKVRQDKKGIQNLSVDAKLECRNCQWKYWCAGGCPLTGFTATGSYNARSPNCSIYKSLFPDILRLEALRLLKRKNFLNG